MSTPSKSPSQNGVSHNLPSQKRPAPDQDTAQQQPNVRHIPIFVEGRDEPMVTKDKERSTKSTSPHPNDQPKAGIFDRVKNFPTINLKQSSAQQRGESPGRTKGHGKNAKSPPRQQFQPEHTPPPASSPKPVPISPIEKIQKVQEDVLKLMYKVEQFTGCSRSDKTYLYLDEMLTQNLLKLDTIDTDGQETIKQARREAIKCINKSISVLEMKADSNASALVAANSATSFSPNSSSPSISTADAVAATVTAESSDLTRSTTPTPITTTASTTKIITASVKSATKKKTVIAKSQKLKSSALPVSKFRKSCSALYVNSFFRLFVLTTLSGSCLMYYLNKTLNSC